MFIHNLLNVLVQTANKNEIFLKKKELLGLLLSPGVRRSAARFQQTGNDFFIQHPPLWSEFLVTEPEALV
jgi:hypothetical protein